MLPTSLLYWKSKSSKDEYYSEYLTCIDTIEDVIRALSILLPGRFEDSNLCSQAILSVINLVSLYHTNVLIKKSTLSEKTKLNHLLSFNERFSQLISAKKLLRTASWTLSMISYTEVLTEMVLSRKVSNLSKWKWIASLEGIKALLRLILFYGTKRQMLLHPTHLIRSVDSSSLEELKEEKLELLTLDPRTGIASSAYSIMANHNGGVTGWMHLSEFLWVLRPVVYVIMILFELRKKQTDLTRSKTQEETIEKEDEGSWKPWLVSLILDLISRLARHKQSMSILEKDESRRRDYLLFYYLFRGPIYLKFTRPLLNAFCNATEHKPLISIITAALNDYRPFWEDLYFYTSAS
ncbi:peroxisome membrane protein [Gilbertella persicaria]|uniref:peroxisome membrane protein n=1 Tax=Gilbertella persicaria TaxID=101096 RepID=UPI00221EF091|nr:peroxisome membrane protein [Gilbertella persicaria]KAI8090089.1 peroxisome membrane protein [Gilbertella persicaria]